MEVTAEHSSGTITLTIKLSRRDVKVLEHNLLDVPAWVEAAVAGKIAACSKRLAQHGRDLLIANGADMLPTNHDRLIDLAISHAGYRNRAARDAEEEKRQAAGGERVSPAE